MMPDRRYASDVHARLIYQGDFLLIFENFEDARLYSRNGATLRYSLASHRRAASGNATRAAKSNVDRDVERLRGKNVGQRAGT